MEAIKLTYRDLTSVELLTKCLHDVILTRVSETLFVAKTALTFGVHDAVLAFNDGNCGRCQVISQLGMAWND